MSDHRHDAIWWERKHRRDAALAVDKLDIGASPHICAFVQVGAWPQLFCQRCQKVPPVKVCDYCSLEVCESCSTKKNQEGVRRG